MTPLLYLSYDNEFAGHNEYTIEAIKVLLEAKANIHARNHRGHTPLIACIFSLPHVVDGWCIEALHLLLEAGADLSMTTMNGKTALDNAYYLLEEDHFENVAATIKMLKQAGDSFTFHLSRLKKLPTHSLATSPYRKSLL